jgi:hypothetical protein
MNATAPDATRHRLEGRLAHPPVAASFDLVRCCQQVGVTQVILPATVARPSLLDRLLRRRVADFRDRLAGVATVLVGPDEVLREPHALGNAIRPKTVGVGGDG